MVLWEVADFENENLNFKQNIINKKNVIEPLNPLFLIARVSGWAGLIR